jgi:large subunit ribosomal protein L24
MTKTKKIAIRQKMHVRKGDTIQVISGRDKGKVGEITTVNPKTSQVTIEGVNVRTKHVKRHALFH